jgi:hypothetical protein
LARSTPALTSIKKLRELVKPKGAETEDPKTIEIRALIVDLQEQVLAAREEALAFRQAALQATEALQRADDFDTRRKQFVRAELNPGSFVYQPVGETAEGVPALACATCMEQDRKIVTLQTANRVPGTDVLVCPKCSGKVTRRNNIERQRPSVRQPRWL